MSAGLTVPRGLIISSLMAAGADAAKSENKTSELDDYNRIGGLRMLLTYVVVIACLVYGWRCIRRKGAVAEAVHVHHHHHVTVVVTEVATQTTESATTEAAGQTKDATADAAAQTVGGWSSDEEFFPEVVGALEGQLHGILNMYTVPELRGESKDRGLAMHRTKLPLVRQLARAMIISQKTADLIVSTLTRARNKPVRPILRDLMTEGAAHTWLARQDALLGPGERFLLRELGTW